MNVRSKRSRRSVQARFAHGTAHACLTSLLAGSALLAACSAEGGARRNAMWPPPLASQPPPAVNSAEVLPAVETESESMLVAVPDERESAVEARAEVDDASSRAQDGWTDPCLEVSELEVYDVLERFYRDFAHGDWTAMSERFWPGASVIAIRRRDQGGDKQVVNEPIEACIERLRARFARPMPLEIALVEYRIEPTGSIAQASVRYAASDKSGDAPQSWSGTDAFTLVRHEGQWRIASLAFGSSTFGP